MLHIEQMEQLMLLMNNNLIELKANEILRSALFALNLDALQCDDLL